MSNFSAANSPKLPISFKAVLALLFTLLVFPSSIVFAQAGKTYSTRQDGQWLDKTTWVADDIAPATITNKDVVEINHKISAGNMKINNGGTLIIKAGGALSGDQLDMNGKDSQVIIKPGAAIEFGNFTFDNTLGGEELIIDNADLNLLPVTLVYFDVKRNAQPNATTLEWITASEKNNAYFAVEKSLDGKSFTEAGRVTGKNSVNGGKYAFEDKNVSARAYYRLKQVDLDGTFTYSAIVTASKDLKMAVQGRKVIFGNAFTGKLHLLNTSGRNVKTIELTNASNFELPEMLQGVYILQLETKTQVTTQRIGL